MKEAERRPNPFLSPDSFDIMIKNNLSKPDERSHTMEPTKQCVSCQETYLATTEFFHVAKRNKDGLHHQCKACRRAKAAKHHQAYYQQHQDEIRQKQQQAYQVRKQQPTPPLSEEAIQQKREANREAVKRYRDNHRETYQAYQREQAAKRVQSPAGRWLKNLSAAKSRARFWHPGIVIDYDRSHWEAALTHFKDECAFCGSEDDLGLGYLEPLAKSLKFTSENIVPACRACRNEKRNRGLAVYYQACRLKPVHPFTPERHQAIIAYRQSQMKAAKQLATPVLAFDDLFWG